MVWPSCCNRGADRHGANDKPYRHRRSLAWLQVVPDLPQRYYEGVCHFNRAKEGPRRPHKDGRFIGKIRVFDRQAKEAQLRASGNYPWHYARVYLQDQTRHSKDGPITKGQAYEILWSLNPEIVTDLAEKQLDLMLTRMRYPLNWRTVHDKDKD